MSVPATMTRPAMTRFGSVDSVLLGLGRHRASSMTRTRSRGRSAGTIICGFSTVAAQTSRRSSAPLVTWCNGHHRPRRPVLVRK